jgi:cytochrome P450
MTGRRRWAAVGLTLAVAAAAAGVRDPKRVVRWAFRHGGARLAFRAAALTGDPFGRLVSDPQLRSDPYPFYDELREQPAVGGRFAVVTARHDIASHCLRSAEFRSGFAPESLPAPARALLSWARDESVTTFLDPPSIAVTNGAEHQRYRKVAMKAFTARAVNALAPHIEKMTDTLLEEMARRSDPRRPTDIVVEFAEVLPVLVIADVLGVPTEMEQQFRQWANAVVAAGDVGVPYRTFARAERATRELNAWMGTHLRTLRATPADNLFSRMIAIADAEPDAGLSELGLVVNGVFLLVAGFETTVNVIGAGIDLMLRHPDQLARLQAEPQGWANAVEEILRYAPPVQNSFRHLGEDGVLAGVPVRARKFVVPLLAAANRDPGVFADPHRFDVTRDNAREHLSFALGAHFCVGAALARLEAEIALRRVFERFPDMSAAGPVTLRPTRMVVGPAHLPVHLRQHGGSAAGP